MQSRFRIGNIEIGEGCAPLVIPEMGINHEGSIEVAKQIVDSAYRAGARMIKHQTHVVEDEMSHVAKTVIPGNSNDSIYDIMSRCALNEEEEKELMLYVQEKGMEFISTPFSRAAAERLERLGVNGYKIGSGEMNNYPLIKYIASFKKPMIVSTGMNDIKSISKTVDIMEGAGVAYALMHTTNLYPTQPYMVRLGAMQEMMKEFSGVPIGLSDHTMSNAACIAAITLGASLVERHYIDKMDRMGPDIICSMDEEKLKELLTAARDIPQMLGGEKCALHEEQVTINFAFASVVAISSIRKGEKFTKENIWVKRPGIGDFLAEEYEQILGCTANCDIHEDELIKKNMVG